MLHEVRQGTDWPEPVWREGRETLAANPRLKGRTKADVAIIGAGFTGLRAALMLAEAGVKTVVLDAKDVGWGASGRNGGQVNPMLPFNSPARVRKLVGDRHFERIVSAALNSADELFDLVDRYQIRCGARRKGWFRALHCTRARRAAEADIESWNQFGAGMQLVDGPEAVRLSGTERYRSGVLTPRGGAVQPLDLVCGLAHAAKRAGARLFGQSAVIRIRQGAASWICSTPSGKVSSEWLIVATNGYTDHVVPGLAKSILPLHPIQMATEPLGNDIAGSILPDGHTISDSRRVIMYARREPDNRMIYGGIGLQGRSGRFTGFDWLKNDAERVFPQLRGARWTHRWGGKIAITADHLPHIHQPGHKMLAGLGYNGRGVAMSMVVGRVMAEHVLGKSGDDLALPVTGIRAFPLQGLTRMGMGATIRLMRLLDRIEAG